MKFHIFQSNAFIKIHLHGSLNFKNVLTSIIIYFFLFINLTKLSCCAITEQIECQHNKINDFGDSRQVKKHSAIKSSIFTTFVIYVRKIKIYNIEKSAWKI